ncbi:DUF1178 family protein [Celeribacter neptunius]|nr:DUF1178 family protein [Celeribacter neptunius]
MIRYMLKCSEEHQFESWFRSAEAFESLKASGQVSCPVCGSSEVQKAMMAPRVSTARNRAEGTGASVEQQHQHASEHHGAPQPPDLPKPEHGLPMTAPVPSAKEVEQAVAKLRAEVEANSDYVGVEFAKEARRIHEGETPARSIYGEAKIDEAKALLEEGVPLLPLPFTPKRKMN